MHQRTLSGRPRQARREKIFRPTSKEDSDNGKPLKGLQQAAELRRGLLNSATSVRTNVTSPDRSRTPIVIKHREQNVATRSRSRDASKTIGAGKFQDRDFGGTFNLTRKNASTSASEGSPAAAEKNISSAGGDALRDGPGYGDLSQSYLDEPQLSKLVSRVLREDERERRLSACRQLRDYAQNAENSQIVQKMGLSLVQELARAFFDRTAMEVKEEIAQCAGMLAATMGRDTQSYLQWLFRKYESTSNEEGQVLLLQTLLETMKWDEGKNTLDLYMPMIMSHMQSALEITDSQLLLVAIVDIVLIVAQRHPDTFNSHFHDTVDILVGWHIDPQQSESIIQYTSDALIQFHRFWVTDISFSVTLLGQFLEDIEAYAEEQSTSDERPVSNDDLPGKIASLFRVYSTVVRSLKDYFSPDQSPHITVSFISENFSRLLSSVLLACNSIISEVILIAANDCVTLLMSHLKDGALPHLEPLTSLILLQMEDGQYLLDKQALSLLKLSTKIVIDLGSRLPVDYLGKIIGPDSLFPKMRFWPNNEIQSHLLDLYRAIFSLKTVSLLEEAYKYLLADLCGAFKTLLDWQLQLNAPYETKFSHKQALTATIFNLCAIAEIGNTRNSLIAMLALNPSIFDLLTNILKPNDIDLAKNYPVLQYAIIFTLYSHCKSHSYFLSSSSLINTPEIPPADRPTTSGHFTAILDLLAKLLENQIHSCDVRSLALDWSYSLLEGAQSCIEQMCAGQSFVQLLHTVITMGFSIDKHVSARSGAILGIVLQGAISNLPQAVVLRCFELCLIKMSDNNDSITNVYEKLFSQLPLGIIFRYGFQMPSEAFPAMQFQNDSSQINGLSTMWQSRRRLQGRSPIGTFTSQDFRVVMAFILQNIKPSSSLMKDMFAMDQRAEKLVRLEDRTFATQADSNKGMLWFWSTSEAALFCVLSKLRTPLGKPQETLATIEVAVKSFASEVLGQVVSEGQYNEITHLNSPNVDPLQPHLRGKILLDFMEQLEKLIYNAYEGCAVALTPAPKAVKTFFRTNKATCQEWLGRVRKAAITLSLQLGHPAFAIRHGYQLLSELRESGATHDHEFNHITFLVVQGLIALRCPDAILGIYVWAKEELGLKLTWVKAAVDMAAGRYEDAAHEFSCILNASSKSKEKADLQMDAKNESQDKPSTNHHIDSVVNSFMKNQILESYRRIGNWSELAQWLEDERQKVQNPKSVVQWPTEMNLDHIRSLTKFDGLGEKHLNLLSKDVPHVQNLWSLNPQFLRQKSEETLLQIIDARKGSNLYTNGINDCCELALKQISGLIYLSTMECPLRLPLEIVVLHHIAFNMKLWVNTQSKIKSFSLPQIAMKQCSSDVEGIDIAALIQAWRWIRGSHELCNSSSENALDTISEIHLVAARTARKQQNLHVAQQLLFNERLSEINIQHNKIMAFMKESAKFSSNDVTCLFVQQCREGSKLLHSLGKHVEAAKVLSSNVISVYSHLGKDDAEKLRIDSSMRILAELNARSLLTLVKWIQQDPSLLSSFPPELQEGSLHLIHDGRIASGSNGCRSSYFVKMVEELPSFSGDGCDVDVQMGRLLWIGTKQCPWLAKAWSELAAWCYKAGKKAVARAGEVGIELNPDERVKIISLLPKESSDQDIATVCQMLSQIQFLSDGEKFDSCQSDDGSENANTRRQTLLSCPVLQSASSYSIEALLVLWSSITKRVYAYYRVASEAYFTFLKLNGSNCVPTCLDSFPGEDGNVTATLRLLRLMVKHASELRDVLEAGLANTPTAPWKGIIPQLFARLNHPEPYVRRSISDLLCRVTAAAPHLIVFPAVVGSSAVLGEIKDSSGILGECLSQPSDDGITDRSDDASQDGEASLDLAEENEQKAAVMQNCFAAMVETLAKQDPRSIAEVQRLVHELRRITLLWDEFWLGTLNQYHMDFSRRISQLEKEINKVKTNTSLQAKEKTGLIAKKHETFLKPTLFVLEQLQQVTSQAPETPHEQWFQETFGPLIQDVIKKLKNPASPDQPQASWQLFKQLLYSLQQRVQKRSSLVLNMAQISPGLANMKATGIAMPGAQTRMDQIVTIEAIDHTVSILPTKTKPKKLVFYGSDGKKYSFLFKGLEDLHLDERIMQLLAIVNNMFVRHRRKGRAMYRARHYTVTPLGPRSGLIQWVEGATPLFGLYKRWQQREAMAPVLRSSTGVGTKSGNQGTVMRPSEIYYNKLTPLLKDKGITSLENRKEWPLSVLRQVLSELMLETPRDLLAKELWCASTSVLEWWKITEMYAQSTAVMSVIGYIIGLGDRHLDNVLVDLETGEVIHIDYNVCFEKGKNLRVPERVPFRMTPNIKSALGFTEVEGTFRVSCEHVLKTLRRGRETLLTLLEAFVYDPLIDWTPGSEGGYTGAVYGGWQGTNVTAKPRKQDMERSLVNNMFYIRMAEMKAGWLMNRGELINSLAQLETLFQTWAGAQSLLQTSEEELQELHQQMAFLKEAEANPSHPLHNLHQRCADYLIVKEHVKAAKISVEEKLSECNHWHKLHESAVDAVHGQELAAWRVEVSKPQMVGALTLPPVIEFLQAAGKGQILQQCEQAEKDVAGLLGQQQTLLSETFDTLATYATIISQSPESYVKENRSYRWQIWLQELCDDFTVAKCHDIISKFHSCYGPESMDLMVVRNVVAAEYQLQTLVGEFNGKLHKLLERLHVENSENSIPSRGSSEESKARIASYISEHGTKGAYSLICVIISTLGSHSRRLGVMESAALADGGRLADYTSIDGDWFLDQIYVVSANIDELVSILYMYKEILSPVAQNAFKTVNSCHLVIASLQELHLNFRTIILPEATKCLQRDESSVLEIFHQLNSLIASIGAPLPVLIQQLELQVRNVVMEMEPPVSKANQLVKELKTKCKPLLEGDLEPEGLSSGQMLLMGFNGLFTKLENDFWHFRELSMPVLATMPMLWRKVDIIKEARALLAPSFLDEAFELLSNIFFVKRLQTMIEFFTLVQHHCWTLKGVNSYQQIDSPAIPSLCSEDCMTRPIRSFIAEFISKMMLGLPNQALGLALCHALECCGINVSAEVDLRDIGAENKVAMEDLCRKAVEVCLRKDFFLTTHFTQGNSLINNWERVWKKQILISRLGQNIMIMKSVLQRAQLQLAHHQWINEDLLIQGSGSNNSTMSTPSRSSIMTDIRKKTQALLSLESNLGLARERYLSLGNSVEQRLRWAAGANPSIGATLQDYEHSVSTVNQLIVGLSKVTKEVAATCNTTLHFEAMRSRTTEAITSDNGFLQLINRCQESCLLVENCQSVVSPLEEKLLNVKLLEKNAVISEWITSVTNRIANGVGEVQRSLTQHKGDLTIAKDALKTHMVTIRSYLATHLKLMNEIRSILKSMAKFEEQQNGPDPISLNIKQYVEAYRSYSEHIAALVKESTLELLTAEHIPAILVTVEGLKISTVYIYDTLVKLGEQLGATDGWDNGKQTASSDSGDIVSVKKADEFPPISGKTLGSGSRKLIAISGGVDLLSGASPASQNVTKPLATGGTLRKTPVNRDPRTGNAVQERNVYALSVWRRVKMKLDGREPEVNKRATVPEQVDHIIKEATCLDNLATLYEGWTPWV